MAKITRRGLLKGAMGLTAVGAASALGVGVYCSRRADAAVAAAGDGPARLALALGDPDGARRVGERYLARFPSEADPDVLAEGIGETVDLQAVRCPATAAAALSAAGRSDFRAGRTVQLDGWVMGRTELRLCAWLARRSA